MELTFSIEFVFSVDSKIFRAEKCIINTFQYIFKFFFVEFAFSVEFVISVEFANSVDTFALLVWS